MAALPMISMALAVGIALGRIRALPAVLLVLLVVAAAITSMYLTRKKKPAAVPLLLLFFCLGMLLFSLAQHQVHNPWVARLGQERVLTGYIEEVLPADEERAAFILRVEKVSDSSGISSLGAAVRVSVYLPPADFVAEYGQRLQITGTVMEPLGQRNPGGFDYGAYLESLGVGAVLSVPGRNLEVLEGSGGSIHLYWAEQLRLQADHILERYLPSDSAGLAAGLLLGDRHAVSEKTLEAYRLLGIAHLLAVSGLHVGFVAAFALFLTSRLWRGQGSYWPAIIAAILVVGYIFLTGGRPPVWRAGLTMLLTLFARQAGRERDGLQGLAAIALLMLFVRPLWLFNLSFQFSFAATTGILLLSPRIDPYLVRLPRRIAGPMAVTMAAQLAVLPLQAVYFGIFSLLAVFANLLCVPLVGVAMALGLAGVLAGLIFMPLAAVFLLAALPALLTLEIVPQALATLSFAAVRLPAFHPLVWFFYLCLLLLIAARASVLPLTGKKIVAVLLILNVLILSPLALSGESQLKVTFVDVGQGMAVHVQTPAGSNLLIDGGRPGRGESVLLPYFRSIGVQMIDLMVLTHPHDDHFGGLTEVAREMPVRLFLHNGETEDSPAYEELLTVLQSAAVADAVLEEGYRLLIDEVELEVLAPPTGRFRYTVDDMNNNSLVLRLLYGEFSLLITGDAETEAIRWLVNNQTAKLDHHILQVPHHGSAGALSEDFLQVAAPVAAVIPVGQNSFGHPRQETLDLLATHNVAVYRTDLHGAVTIISDGVTWQFKKVIENGEE